MSVKVSVIVPVYNVEKYLRQTMDTIIHQSLEDIEIICVDDGSTDRSVDILKEYQQKDPRIQLIYQKNQYAGVARNHGLAKAKGDYVVFWDSDDLFEPKALELMYKQCLKDEADLCVCAANRYDSLTQKTIYSGTYLKMEWLPQEIPFSKYSHPRYLFNFSTNVPWNKMWKREFIEKNQLQFQPLKQANDTYFSMMSYFLADRITIVNKPLMSYRINNEKSLTGKASQTTLCSYQAYQAVYEQLSSSVYYYGDVVLSFQNRLINGMLYALKTQTHIESFQEIYSYIKEHLCDDFQIDPNLDEKTMDIKKDYLDFKSVLENSPEQFLLNQYQKINKNIYTRGNQGIYKIYYSLYYSKLWKLCMIVKNKLRK